MSLRSASQRLLLLFLIAVLLPSIVVTVMGVRLVRQERELAVQRPLEARRKMAVDVGDTLLRRLSAAVARVSATVTIDTVWTSVDPVIVEVLPMAGDRPILPWREQSATDEFQRQRDDPGFARAMRRGERADFIAHDTASALEAYRQARTVATGSHARAYARLQEARLLPYANRYRALLDLVALPISVRDEFSVPFALYAAQGLQHLLDTVSAARAAERMLPTLMKDAQLSPEACHAARQFANASGHSVLAASLNERCLSLEGLERLAHEWTNQPDGDSGTTRWVLWPPRGWLVHRSNHVGHESLVIADARRALDESGGSGMALTAEPLRDDAEPLGAEFPSAYLRIPSGAVPQADRTRELFYLGVLVMVLAFALSGAYLLWRDVRREAALVHLRADFVRGVTHELKTPLTSIRMYAETLYERPALPSDVRDTYLATILSESERLTRLLDSVLDFSRIERGDRAYTMTPLPITEVTTKVVRTMHHPLSQLGFHLKVDDQSSGAFVRADRDAIQQALLNLLTNAIKYSGGSRHLELSVHTAGDRVLVDVRDSGIGIAPEYLDRIFEQFYRVPVPQDTGVTGAGLGLFIVRHIIESHGGTVSVTSTPGSGSRFRIELPRVATPDASRDGTPGPADPHQVQVSVES